MGIDRIIMSRGIIGSLIVPNDIEYCGQRDQQKRASPSIYRVLAEAA